VTARALPLLGLAILPAATAAGFALLPAIRVSEGLADAGAAAFTSLAAIASLVVATRASPSLRVRIALGGLAALLLVAIAITRPASLASVALVGLGLVTVGWALGDGIGRRIAHPGHVAPACAVAGGADLMSVLSPEGPSKAIAASDAAVSVLVVAGPVPGHAGAIAPTIGAGDLVFIALLLGAAAVHGASRVRVALAAIVGVAASLLASGLLRAPIPALPAVGIAAVAFVPAFRDIRPRDRSAATVGIAIGVSLGVVAVVRAMWT
jgi:hypothetical protein